MGFPAKFVAVVVLLAFTLAPAFAVVHCEQSALQPMHCGHHCGMMMKAAESGLSRLQLANPDGSCCRVFPAPLQSRPSVVQSRPEHATTLGDSAGNRETIAFPRGEIRALPGPPPSLRSQSVLCTFLI
jgi:hypothetical protein